MPVHGEIGRQEIERVMTTDTYTLPGGNEVALTYASEEGTRKERWCAVCNEWVMPKGFAENILSIAICVKCGTDWR